VVAAFVLRCLKHKGANIHFPGIPLLIGNLSGKIPDIGIDRLAEGPIGSGPSELLLLEDANALF
jgi:hypothetical protein